MRKLIIVAGLLLFLFLTTLFAQPDFSRNDEITQKLDKILKNQEEMFEYLRFIKNRAR